MTLLELEQHIEKCIHHFHLELAKYNNDFYELDKTSAYTQYVRDIRGTISQLSTDMSTLNAAYRCFALALRSKKKSNQYDVIKMYPNRYQDGLLYDFDEIYNSFVSLCNHYGINPNACTRDTMVNIASMYKVTIANTEQSLKHLDEYKVKFLRRLWEDTHSA